ncbi:MAG: hypothetical protein RL355_703 [Actinomycetota bacterium]|jgi:O-antigen ligase
MFSAFMIAQIADGYYFNVIHALLFCAAMSFFAAKIKSAFVLGAYVGMSILLAHFIIATYSINYSSELFFPSIWGPLDLLLMLMMWSSPLLVIIADAFDTKIGDALKLRLFKALVILKSQVTIIVEPTSSLNFWQIKVLQDQFLKNARTSRAPPFVVV